MNLERIELYGFKSFADRTVIPLKDGFTAIIGPNGCGKSNVAEAIRWTLGEQSAKALRGKSMSDVIFAGTEKRRSLSYAEVSLVFNNEKGKVFASLPFDEVKFTRKLDKSGKSEYFINNTHCLMKDIINLLHDTGIGKEGYSIIGQGRIDEILSAKPENRRNIFEEAAGISKFRSQRGKSLANLEKARLNLQTISEVISEIERQLVPLRRQAESAKKYFALKDALKRQEVNLYIYNYENNESIKQKIFDRLDAVNKELEAKTLAFNGCIAEYEKALLENSTLDRSVEEANAELLSLKVDAEKVAGQANLLKERINNLNAEISRLNNELNSVDARLVVSDNLIASAESNKESILAHYIEVSKEYETLAARLEKLSRSIAGQESDLESKNAEYIRAIQELGALRSNSSSYVAEKSINEERAKNLLSLINEKKAKFEEESTNLSVYDSKVKVCREEIREKLSRYNEAMSDKNDSAEAIKGIDEDVIQLNSKLGLAEGNLRLYTAIREEYSGFQDAVRRLMTDAKNDFALKDRILGVLAEVVSVPKEFESAIEYALGGNLQNVLVENERDAAQLITYLKQKNYGRATFRPRTACKPRTLSGMDREVLNEQGCLGVAADLVNYSPEFDDFIRSLLGTTVICDNMASGERLWKKYNRNFKIVTLDGEIYTRGGEVTGGSRRQQTSGLLSQESQIAQAKENVERIKRNIAQIQNQREDRKAEVAACEEIIKELNEEIGQLRVEIGLNEDKAKQAAQIVESLNGEISTNAAEYELVREQIKIITEKLSSIDELEKVVQSRESAYNELVSESKSQSGEQKSERETLNEQVMSRRVEMTQLKSSLDGADADIFRLKREMESAQEEKLDLIAEIKRAEAQLENITSAPEKTSFSTADLKRINELEILLGGLSEKKRTLSDKLVELNNYREKLAEEKNDLSEKKIRDENMLERVDDENRYLQEHILEEYDLTYASALEFKDEDFEYRGVKTVIADLKKDISRLGEVNPLAVETLKETEERHEEYVKQLKDEQDAYDDIMKVIATLTDEMKVKFVEAFEKIQTNFKDIFMQLFGGGKGELRFDTSETDDPLEAGIEIFAQPPGKSLKHISLLSGGERALTAIAILFSILRLKPMPFCVLDEIEAALDESNANLFAEFIKRFSDFTQFIVITHRKPTMRHADSIFGVTMEERGITKIVGIEFEDAVRHASDGEGEDNVEGVA